MGATVRSIKRVILLLVFMVSVASADTMIYLANTVDIPQGKLLNKDSTLQSLQSWGKQPTKQNSFDWDETCVISDTTTFNPKYFILRITPDISKNEDKILNDNVASGKFKLLGIIHEADVWNNSKGGYERNAWYEEISKYPDDFYTGGILSMP